MDRDVADIPSPLPLRLHERQDLLRVVHHHHSDVLFGDASGARFGQELLHDERVSSSAVLLDLVLDNRRALDADLPDDAGAYAAVSSAYPTILG